MTNSDELREKFYRIFYHTRKWVWFVSLALSIFLVVAAGIAQYWLPTLLSDKQEVERYLSELSKQTITVGRIHSHWDGIFPGIRATNIVIQDPASDKGTLSLKEVRLSLSYRSVLAGRAILNRFVLVGPDLEIVRDRSGKVRVSGIRGRNQAPAAIRSAPNSKPAGNSVAVNWLLAQGRIEIQQGNLVWTDWSGARPDPLHLGNVNLVLQNQGNRHLLEFAADFPADICGVCTFSADIIGNPLVSKNWGGFINVDAIGLNLRNRLTLMSNKFPAGLDGKVDMVLRSQWTGGQPRLAFGRVTANDIDIPLGKFGKSLTVNELISTLKWRSRKDTWSLEMDLPFVRIDDEPWLPGQLKVSRYVGGTGLYLRHLDIGRALTVAERFRIPEKQRRFIANLKPKGSIDDLYIDLKDKTGNGDEEWLNVKASLRGIHTLPYKKIPGFKGLSATIDSTERRGVIYLNSQRSEFNSTHVFREPIPVHRAKARITWQNANNVIEVNTQNIQIVGQDISARGGFIYHFPLDRTQSPRLDLKMRVFDGVVARTSVYLPVNVMKPALVKWLDKAVVSGKMTDGHVIYQGKTREFPFIDNNGLFEVLANVDHAKLQYLPGWKPISSANMKLLFRGNSMVITGSAGKVDRLDIAELVASKRNLKDRSEPVRVSGRLTGAVSNALAVLRNAAANGQKGGWTRFVESSVSASGNGQLSLGIEIPTNKKTKYRLDGRYEFLGGGMVLPIGDIPAQNMLGAIRFNQSGILDGAIRANTLGGPVNAVVKGKSSPRDPDTVFSLSGRVTTTGLSREYGRWIQKYFGGAIPWSGQIRFNNGIPDVELEGDVRSVTTSLPEPVLPLARSTDKLTLTTSNSSEKRHLLRLALGDQFSGLLDYQARGSGWRFTEGHLLVGGEQPTLRGDGGLHLRFTGDRVDAGKWVDVVYSGAGGDDIPELVQGVSGRFGNVDFLGRDWGSTEFAIARPGPSRWSGSLNGETISGKLSLDTQPRGGRIALDLDRLHIPKGREQEETEQSAGGDELDPRSFPTLQIASKDFSVGPMKLGRLDFSAEHTRIGWEIDRLQFTRPDMSLFADGTWFRVAGNHVTKGKLRFTSSNLGESFAALGSPDQITGGKMNMDANFNWRQDRKNKGLANLNGEISIHAENGQINKIKADGGQGTISLFALSRYLSLDFSPALGKGFAFNNIKGKIAIQQGDARTDGFTLTAPAAAIVARGHVDLHERDMDVHADIYPNLKSGVTVATGSLFGLQAAAWIYALQQLFSSEIEQGTRISYRISGTMDDPKVTKVVSEIDRQKSAQ